MGFTGLGFCGGLSWLVMNYRYSGRPWWKLIGSGCSCAGTVTVLAITLAGSQSLLAVAYGLWAWTAVAAVTLSMDSRYEHYAGQDEEEGVPEYAIGTPHDPRMNSQRIQQGR